MKINDNSRFFDYVTVSGWRFCQNESIDDPFHSICLAIEDYDGDDSVGDLCGDLAHFEREIRINGISHIQTVCMKHADKDYTEE